MKMSNGSAPMTATPTPVHFQVGNVLWVSGFLENCSAPIEIHYYAGDGTADAKTVLKIRINYTRCHSMEHGNSNTRMKVEVPYVELRVLFGASGFDLFDGHKLVNHLPYKELWNGQWLGDREAQTVQVLITISSICQVK